MGRSLASIQLHRRAKIHSCTLVNGKGSRLDLTREQTVDACTHNDETAEDIAPVEDDSHVSDLLEQEPGSLRMESPGVDEMDDSSWLEHDNSPSESPTRCRHDDNWVSHPDSEPPDEEVNLQEDNDPVPGLEVQPDDLPSGPNNWNPDDLVPHLDMLHNSLNFVDRLRMASLDNDAIPPDIRERLRSPPTALPVIDADLCMYIKIFLGMTNGSQSMYETVCWAI